MHIVKPCKKHVKKKTPHKQIQECSDALNKSSDIIQELVSAHEDPSFGLGADALPHAEGTIPSQGNKDNMEIDIDHHIAKQKNEELQYKARYKKLMEVMTKPRAREWPPKSLHARQSLEWMKDWDVIITPKSGTQKQYKMLPQ
jgi:hypothetical protein